MTMDRANELRSAEATVGLAFLQKKLPRVLTQKLLELASAAGLRLLPLDPHQSLEAQAPAGGVLTMTTTTTSATTGAATTTAPATGRCFITQPFDVILHKLHTDPVWEAHLADYTARHPGVRVLDSLSAIRATDDRAAMLAAIPPSGLRLSLHAAPAASAATAPVHTASAATPQLVGPEPQQQQRPQQQQSTNLSSAAAAAAVRYGSCGGSSVEGSGDGEGGGGGGDADAAAVAAAWRSGMELEVEVRAPAQAVVGSREKVRALVAAAAAGGEGVRPMGLRPPLILKTQRADAAGGGGHGLAVALTWDELVNRAEDMQRAAAAAGAAAATPAAAASAGAGGSGNVGRGQVDGEESSWVPLVVQQYVSHTENLYKVYVLGDHVQAERRASLTLSQLTTLQQAHAERSAGQRQQQTQQQQEPAAAPAAAAMTSVSGAAAMAAPPCPLLLQHISAQPQPQSGDGPTVPPPPPAAAAAPTAAAAAGGPGRAAPGAGAAAALDDRILGAVARELSLRMGLTMFNFDVVVAVPDPLTVPEVAGESASGGSGAAAAALMARRAGAATGAGRDPLLLYVVDVNYFPGYDKMTGWEPHLVAHLRSAADGMMMRR